MKENQRYTLALIIMAAIVANEGQQPLERELKDILAAIKHPAMEMGLQTLDPKMLGLDESDN